jgi:hypothetical protein
MFTLIFYGENWREAERLADAERKDKRKAGVRDARVFTGEPEARIDAVVVLPCVDDICRDRLVAAYGAKVQGHEPPKVEAGEYRAVHRGRGSYSVMRGDDEIVEGLTRLEYQSFNTYSPAEQAAFVANRAKG